MRQKALILLCLFLLAAASITACSHPQTEQLTIPKQIKTKSIQTGKKVIILMIDSLLSPSIDHLVAANQVPALSFLIRNGIYKRDVISSFPTMSVTIESSLLTGTYPDQHGVPGLLWYSPQEKRIVDYGDGLRVTWKPGLPTWLLDSTYHLNQTHLSPKVTTLYEELHNRGYTSASINGLVYRGKTLHNLAFPKLIPNALGTPPQLQVKGPDILAYGTLSKVSNGRLPDGPLRSYGFNNSYTTESLLTLIRAGALPDVTVAYFPDLDGKLHKYGPSYVSGIKQVDQELQRILSSFGEWNQALQNNIFIVMGDSGVTATGSDRQTSLINLEKVLRGYRITPLGKKAEPQDDIAFAINGRMSYVYSLSSRAPISALIERAKQDNRIDLIAWSEAGWINVIQGGTGKQLAYRPGKGREQMDKHGQKWELRGDPKVLDSYTYPDGRKRLASVFSSHQGQFLVLTARPGMEFTGDGSPNHPGGGNHGSMERTDSLLPLIVSGKGPFPSPPDRVVDVKQYVLSLLKR